MRTSTTAMPSHRGAKCSHGDQTDTIVIICDLTNSIRMEFLNLNNWTSPFSF